MDENSHSIPIIYRLHKHLWEMNRQTLEFAMNEAKERVETPILIELATTVVQELVELEA